MFPCDLMVSKQASVHIFKIIRSTIRSNITCPMTSDFWFQFSIRLNTAENQETQITGQGYIWIYLKYR